MTAFGQALGNSGKENFHEHIQSIPCQKAKNGAIFS